MIVATVLNVIRGHFYKGQEFADLLQLTVDMLAANYAERLHIQGHSELKYFGDWLEPSIGYEPLLEKAGMPRYAARAVAKFSVNEGRRQWQQSTVCRQMLADIRFIGKFGRQSAAVRRRIERLHKTFNANERTAIEFLSQITPQPLQFIELAKSAAGDRARIQELVGLAAKASLPAALKRGVKITPASWSHEFFLQNKFRLWDEPFQRSHRNRRAEYVDALTAATRAEHQQPNFDQRPAERRAKLLRRREKL